MNVRNFDPFIAVYDDSDSTRLFLTRNQALELVAKLIEAISACQVNTNEPKTNEPRERGKR